MSARCDLFIAGAGPAGMAASVAARHAGWSVVVADEGAAAGGQIYRGVRLASTRIRDALGPDYAKGRTLAEEFATSGAQHLRQASVFLAEPTEGGGYTLGVSQQGSATFWQADRVLIATGALERPFPIPGWTLPGVMTAGAAQTLLKSSGIVPSGRVVLAGTGPLLLLLAAQYLRLGVKIDALLDTTPRGNWRRALPHLPGFLTTAYARKGLALLREISRAMPIHRGVTALAAEGSGRLQAVVFDGKRIDADSLLLHQGVVPQVNLAMALGVPHRWNDARLAFEPEIDADGSTALPGLLIVGDSAGIGGAEAAALHGRLAVQAVLGQDRAATQAVLRKALRGRGFLDALYRPADAHRLPEDNVIICRCEEVTAGEIRALARRGTQGPNQAKAFSRAGMGPCQGRSCALTVCELMAHTSARSPSDIGHMRIRNPIKPVTLGEIAGDSA